MKSIKITQEDIRKGLFEYLTNWQSCPDAYDVVTKDTDPERYARLTAPLFFNTLVKVKDDDRAKQSTIEFLQVFYDLQIDLKFLLACAESVGDGYLINQAHMNNLRRSSAKLDVLLGVARATTNSPHPIAQKNKSKSNHPECSVDQY